MATNGYYNGEPEWMHEAAKARFEAFQAQLDSIGIDPDSAQRMSEILAHDEVFGIETRSQGDRDFAEQTWLNIHQPGRPNHVEPIAGWAEDPAENGGYSIGPACPWAEWEVE